MAPKPDSSDQYQTMKARLKTLLPEQYQDTDEEVQPVSMGSAGLKYGPDGRVAWDEIWGSFCDLAMAGGPPHRGTLLEPATDAQVDAAPERYRHVSGELCRGVEMVSGLAAEPSRVPGWIAVDCPSTKMAGWLVRAINMENVSAHTEGMVLHLPASPHFRLEKEIKNVVTSLAKTVHYWLGHTSAAQHRAVGDLIETMEVESPLIQAPFDTRDKRTARAEHLRDTIAREISVATGLPATGREYDGWLGVDCLSVPSAVWVMRAVVASNVLCRREAHSIFIPIDSSKQHGYQVVARTVGAYRMARAQGAI